MREIKQILTAALLATAVLMPGALQAQEKNPAPAANPINQPNPATGNKAAKRQARAKPGKRAKRVKPTTDFTIAPQVGEYKPLNLPDDIAPTPGTMNDPNDKVKVFGEPRMSKGHPCTLWDQQDLANYKNLLKTDKVMQKELAALQASADARIKQPLNVPATHKGPDGKWLAPSEFPKAEAPEGNQTGNTEANSNAMVDLATVYVFTGDAKYAEYCRKMLLAYAENFPKWGRPAKATWRSAKDQRLTFQFLNDGFVIARMAWAYDLIHDLPSFTADDRVAIRENLFHAMVTPYFTHGRRGPDYLSTVDNRSCICASAVLLAGYACEDQGMIDFALHGAAGTTLKPIATEAVPLPMGELGSEPSGKPPGGVMGVHFSDKCLLPDGFWDEGAPAYTFGIASAGLFNDAEILWHHGVNMYAYDNGALKRLLDSGILIANPDPSLTIPGIRDSESFDLLDKRDWQNGQIGMDYFLGYRRYQDPRYLPIIRNAVDHLTLTVHSGPPLIKENLPDTPAPAIAAENVNFYSVGYGILRVTGAKHTNSLLMQYGQAGEWSSHDHPSLLGIDLYTWGDTLAPFPGVFFPYNNPLDPKWYHTTIANCAMEVDQDNQLYAGNRYFQYKGAPKPECPQIVYAPAASFGMQRACSSAASFYPGTTQDRALFMTSNYVADLFGGFSTVPRTYDLAWHFRGKVSSDLALQPWKFPEPVANGYNALDNVKSATTDKAWSATITFHDKPMRFFATAGAGTQVITGDGYFKKTAERPPTIIERRDKTKSALYGTVIELSGDAQPYIQSVTQEGDVDVGYGLLKIETKNGTDLCFAAYRPGTYKAAGMETDAVQAMVTMDGDKVSAAYLAGGKILKTTGITLERSEPGLAYVEKMPDGTYMAGNPSPTDATITVTLGGTNGGAPFKKELKAGSKVAITQSK